MPLTAEQKLASEMRERNDASIRWMESNYYGEWLEVYKSYRCERDPEKDDKGKDDLELTSIGTPLTTSYVNRTVDRITAQPPNIRYRSKDDQLAELISRKLMYDWDKGGIQRWQKKHCRQGSTFGWSVRGWYWDVEDYPSRKRIDPFDEKMAPANLPLIDLAYGDTIKEWTGGATLAQLGQQDQQQAMQQQLPPSPIGQSQLEILQRLMAEQGKGNLLKVARMYKKYEGPRAEVLFVGDCYPEPNADSIQSGQYFQVERRRDKPWLEKLVKTFPEFAPGVEELFRQRPKGSEPNWSTASVTGSRASSGQNFRAWVQRAYSGQKFGGSYNIENTNEWTILEEHVPGEKGKYRLLAENDIWLGEIDAPYDLEGKIPFTELILIDDLLGGPGESLPRFFRGLQQLHDKHVNVYWQMMYNILRPLIGTTSREFFENPDIIKRGAGFRLVKMSGPNDLWVQGEQAAIAHAASGLNNFGHIMSMFQMITGENNMSLSANVDPQQGRTATGARIMAFNGDIISKGAVDMFNFTSLQPDAEMMFLLNRSEMTDVAEFEPGRYNRNYSRDEDPIKTQWAQVEPMMFQADTYEIMVEVGSTLAADDEMKSQRAIQLAQVGLSRPDVFDQRKVGEELVKSHGFGDQLNEWAAKPQPPPPPQQPKPSLSINVRAEMYPPSVQAKIFASVGIQVTGEEILGVPQAPPMPGGQPPMAGAGAGPPPMGGAPMNSPMGPPKPNGMGALPAPPPPAQILQDGAYAASRGQNPLG
jgi:hypothetical protein